MPSPGWRLYDDQVVAVVTYIRDSWGNAVSPVAAEAVKTERSNVTKTEEQDC
jgi:hypothetical protein